MTKNALVYSIRTIVIKAGLRENVSIIEEGEEKQESTSKDPKKSSRKTVALNHGFRKFVHTKMTLAKVDIEIREILLGHFIGLSDSYYRPTPEQCLEEYLKVIYDLTINNEFRLSKQVEKLKEKGDYQNYVIDKKCKKKMKRLKH